MKENATTAKAATAKKQQEKDKKEEEFKIRHIFAAFTSLPRVLGLVWATDKRLTFAMAFISVARGFIPAISVFITKQLIDSVVRAIFTHVTTLLWILVAVQLAVNLLNSLMTTLSNIVQQLLQEKVSNRVQLLILEKANTLDLAFFEDDDPRWSLCRTLQSAGRGLSLTAHFWQLGYS